MIKKNADKINALCKETVQITDILNKQDISEELRNNLYYDREKLFKEIKKYVKKER